MLLIFVLTVTCTLTEDASSISSTVSLSSSSPPVCSCDDGGISTLEENAKKMQEQTKNKTMINKIKHRVSHSSDALWASVCLSSLLGVMMLALLQTKMWNDNTFLSYPESQPSKYEQDNHNGEVKVKQLIKSKGKKLLKHFSCKKRKSNVELQGFRMESFLKHSGDDVDGVYQELIESSLEDAISDESDEDVVYSLNKRTGQWQSGNILISHRGDSRGNYRLLDTSNSRDLSRQSESSTEDNQKIEPLISV